MEKSFKVFKLGTEPNKPTCAKGYVNTTYEKLVEVFGEPTEELDELYSDNGKKVTCRWSIFFADGGLASIYNWKTSRHHKEVTNWHIGGAITSKNPTQRVQDTLNQKTTKR